MDRFIPRFGHIAIRDTELLNRMSYRTALAAIDRRFPGRAVFRATYRIPNVAQTVIELEAAFRVKFGHDQGYTLTKHVLNDTYSLLYFRGYTSGFSFGLFPTKDDSGKLIVQTGGARTSKLSHGASFFAMFLALLVFFACLVTVLLLGIPLPNLVLGAIALVVALVSFFVIYHLILPLIARYETRSDRSLPDETMNEIVGTFREIVEKNGKLISE